MKRFVYIITIVLVTIGLSACGGKSSVSTGSHQTSAENAKSQPSKDNQKSSANSAPSSDSNQVSTQSSNSKSTGDSIGNGISDTSDGNANTTSTGNGSEKSTPNPQPVSLPTGEAHASKMDQIDFVNKEIGFVTTTVNNVKDTDYLLATTNGGQVWNKIKLPVHSLLKISFLNEKMGWGIAQGANGNLLIVKTNDGGQHWTTEWETSSKQQGPVSLHMFDASSGWALINQQVIKTTDGGKHWTYVLKPSNAFTPDYFNFLSTSTGYVLGRKTNPSQGSDLAKTYNIKILKTTDGGASWTTSYLSKTPGNVTSDGISFSDSSNGWFLTGNLDTWRGNVYRTSDGGKHWTMEKQVGGMRPYPTEIKFLTSQFGWIPYNAGAGPIGGGLDLTHDGGKTFTGVGFKRGWSLDDVQMLTMNEGWATGSIDEQSYFLMHTTDGGKTWKQVYPKLQPTKDIQFVNQKVGYGIGTRANPFAVLKTEDGGVNWSIISNFSSTNQPVSISFSNSTHGFLYTRNGKAQNVQEILETNDGGKTWTTKSTFTATDSNLPGDYLKLFNKDQGIFEKTKFPQLSLIVTTDDGKTWSPLVSKSLNLKGAQKGNQTVSFVAPDEGYILTNDKERFTLNKYEKGTWSQVHLPQQLETLRYLQMQQFTFTTVNQGWLYVSYFPSKSQSEKHELFVTQDGGKSWNTVPVPQDTNSRFIKVDFINAQQGWLLTNEGLKYTRDGGAHWTWI